MRFTKSSLGVALAMTILVGCQKNEPSLLNPDGTTNLSAVVFAVVGGRPLTAADVKDTVMITAKISELAKKPIKKNKFAKWANNYAAHITPSLVSAMLLEDEAKREGTETSADDIAKELSKYNRMAKQDAASLEELAPLFGDLGSAFRRQFERECLFSAFFRRKAELQVTDDDLTVYFEDVTNRLNQARTINDDAWKRGEAIYARLKAGEDWERVAPETTEDALLDKTYANNWKEWSDAPLSSIDYDDVRTNVAALVVGGFTHPVETSEGLVIVKLLGIENDFYRTSRILLRMAYDVEVPSVDAAKKELAAEKMKDFQLSLLGTLRAQTKIEYPLGQKIMFKIWPEEESGTPRSPTLADALRPQKPQSERVEESVKAVEAPKEGQ